MSEEVQNPEAVLAELRRTQEDLKTLRAQLKEVEKERDEIKQAVDGIDDWKTKALSAETKLALQGSGLTDVERLMKYVGTDGLEFGEDGKVSGLDERLKELKTDLPELFDPKRRVGGKADIHADSEAKVDPFRASVRQALQN